MKTVSKLLLCVLVLISCNQEKAQDTELKDTTPEPEALSLEGIWELTNYYTYEDNEVIDSFSNNADYRQIKMYQHGKVMWSRKVPIDSIEWYGYGSYQITDTSLTETIEYGSASMLKIIDTMRVFTFELELEKNKYRQINIDIDGNRMFSENYVRIEEP